MKSVETVRDQSTSFNQDEKAHELEVYEQQLQTLEDELQRRKELLEQKKRDLTLVDPNQHIRNETMTQKMYRLWCPPCSPGKITDEIPFKLQRFIWKMYYLWLYNSFCIIFNAIVMVVLNNHHQTIQDFNVYIPLSLFYLVFGIPLSWYIWYRRIFKSVSLQSQVRFMIFNMNYMVHIIFVAIMTLGFSNIDAAGLITMIHLYSKDQNGLGLLTLISTCFWFVDLTATLICYKRCFDAHEQIQFTKFIKNRFDNVVIS